MSALTRQLRDAEIRPWRIVLAVAAGTAGLGSAVGLAAVAAWLIATAALMPSPADVAVAAVAVRTFGIGRGAFRYLERLVSHDIALAGMASLRERTYARIAAGDPGAVLALRRGDIMARLGSDMDAVGDAVVRSVIPTLVAATVSLGAIAISASLHPTAGAVLAVCLLLAGVGPGALTARSARVAATRGTAAHAALTAATLHRLEHATEQRVWGTAGAAASEIAAADREAEAAQDDAARPAALAAAVQSVASGLALVASVAIAVMAVRDGTLSGPHAAVVALLPLAAFEAVGAIPAGVMQWFRSSAAAERIEALAPWGAPESAQAIPPVVTSDGSPDEPAHGTRTPVLHLNGVSAAWQGATPTPPVTALLAPGEVLGVIGRSGVGKTTLLLTLAGAKDPAAGAVTVDAVPVGPRHTGTVVAVTPEDAHIFGTTVFENLRVARGDLTREGALAALHTVGLGDWVAGLPAGLETVIGSGGHSVSGGERRRLLLARVLAHPAPIQLVDEPAEHLDAQGSLALERVLGELTARGGSVVIVTHDLTNLTYVDKVVNLDD